MELLITTSTWNFFQTSIIFYSSIHHVSQTLRHRQQGPQRHAGHSQPRPSHRTDRLLWRHQLHRRQPPLPPPATLYTLQSLSPLSPPPALAKSRKLRSSLALHALLTPHHQPPCFCCWRSKQSTPTTSTTTSTIATTTATTSAIATIPVQTQTQVRKRRVHSRVAAWKTTTTKQQRSNHWPSTQRHFNFQTILQNQH